jgi:hypothetical protein
MDELKKLYGTIVVVMDDVLVNTSVGAYDRLRKIVSEFGPKTIEDRGRLSKKEINSRDEREIIFWMMKNKHRKEKGVAAAIARNELKGSQLYSEVFDSELYSKLKLTKIGKAVSSSDFIKKPSIKKVVIVVETLGENSPSDAKLDFLKESFSNSKVDVVIVRKGDSLGDAMKKSGIGDSWDSLITDSLEHVASLGFHFKDLGFKRFVLPSCGYNSGKMSLSEEIIKKYNIRHIEYVEDN